MEADSSQPDRQTVPLEHFRINPDLAWTGDAAVVTILDLSQPAAKPLQLSGPLAQAFIWIHQGVEADAEAVLIQQLHAAGAISKITRD